MGFGSNLGDRIRHFSASCQKLTEKGYSILRASSLYDTEPWGRAPGGVYLNAVLEIERRGDAADFLKLLLEIEVALGRTRPSPMSPRTCDLDLLLWGSERITSADLVVPHPRLTERRFVLIPLCDLIPDGLHPTSGLTFTELLESCTDTLQVWPHRPPNLTDKA
ncbi:2-amino-4-hydroxy-6-hydroxymethyldihydropteridine diphosphokinase [candidate division KSB1 bacterium]|nr:MAG: 2-amino-4-hydroxy-6-hydroxymethyldihydropteridine diphosphokinase [candidate division KSB1 bacterium]